MLSNRDIDILLYYLDKGIQEEIQRICNVPVASAAYESLVNAEDVSLAQSMGITL